MCAPVALFAYSRLDHTKRVIDSLLKNPEAGDTELYIFCDGPKDSNITKNILELRSFLRKITGFKKVVIEFHDKNIGLAQSIKYGVSKVIDHSGRLIVLEDDILVSPGFLKYMNSALERYKNNHEVISISGYVYPTKDSLPNNFFIRGADCWGWATWDRGWNETIFDANKLLVGLKNNNLLKSLDYGGSISFSSLLKEQAEGVVDSWAICWHASAFLKGRLTLYPGKSLVQNIGNDNSGTHAEKSNKFNHHKLADYIFVDTIEVCESSYARDCFSKFFYENRQTLLKKSILRLSVLIKKLIIKCYVAT